MQWLRFSSAPILEGAEGGEKSSFLRSWRLPGIGEACLLPRSLGDGSDTVKGFVFWMGKELLTDERRNEHQQGMVLAFSPITSSVQETTGPGGVGYGAGGGDCHIPSLASKGRN